MDMYEITLNVMYTATVFFIAFTAIMLVFDKEQLPELLGDVVVSGWLISVAVWLASIITLIWVK